MSTPEKPKVKRVQMEMRLSHEEKEWIRFAAALSGQSMNQFIVSGLVRRAAEILQEGEDTHVPMDVTDEINP